MSDQKNDSYRFSWEDLGDPLLGRPNLGNSTNIICYRLLQYTFKDTLRKQLGREKTTAIFKGAGHLAGTHFCRNILDASLDFNAFIADLANKLVDYKIAILRVENADMAKLHLTITLSEDLDCSGLPVYGETVCDYDEGFLAGILEVYTGKPFFVKEVDCWATNDRTCRFIARPESNPGAS